MYVRIARNYHLFDVKKKTGERYSCSYVWEKNTFTRKKILSILHCFFRQVHQINANITLLHKYYKVCICTRLALVHPIIHRYIMFLFLFRTLKFRIAYLKVVTYAVNRKNAVNKMRKVFVLIELIKSIELSKHKTYTIIIP